MFSSVPAYGDELPADWPVDDLIPLTQAAEVSGPDLELIMRAWEYLSNLPQSVLDGDIYTFNFSIYRSDDLTLEMVTVISRAIIREDGERTLRMSGGSVQFLDGEIIYP